MTTVSVSPFDDVRGDVVLSTDPGYDEARLAWNLAVDQRPFAVVVPVDAADVAACVRGARAQGLRVAPQSTGHGAAPRGDLSRSVLVRLDAMRSVSVDPVTRTACVGGGAQWGDVVAAALPHGLAPLAGSAPDVGVAGFTLGGGLSWFARRHGLSSAALVGAELVTADGEVVRADAELLWALRGGGGAFGIVTSLSFSLLELPEVYAGAMLWPVERAGVVLRAWRDWSHTAAESITTSARIVRVPPMVPDPQLAGRAFVMIDGADLDGDTGALAPLRALAPEIDTWATQSPAVLQQMHMDPPTPVPAAGTGALLDSVSDAAIDALIEVAGADSDCMLMIVELRQLGGALRRSGEGALASIDAAFALFSVGPLMAPEMAAPVEAQLAAVRAAFAGGMSPRAYANFAEQGASAEALYGEQAAARLRAIAARVDPDGAMQPNHALRSHG